MSDARPLHVINNEQGEIIEIYENIVRIIVPKLGFWKKMNRPMVAPSEGTYVFPLDTILIQIHLEAPLIEAYMLTIHNQSRPGSQIKLFASGLRRNDWIILENYISEKKAGEKERNLDYEGAIQIYDSIGKPQEAARVRKLKTDLAAPKTVVQGDYVDDRDTIVKDSVINRSNVGAGGKSKAEQIKEIKELLDSGAIDKDDYEKMKREIIG